MTSCLTENELGAIVDGTLSSSARTRLEGHVAHCAACRALLAATLRAFFPEDTPADTPLAETPGLELRPGQTLDRYVIHARIGGGGGGTVYAAEDPELQRKVALKLLRPSGPGQLEVMGARLRREAQAMARLRHPNVVTVFDVGVYEGQLFIAMDLIEGQTLRGWLAKQRRTWREVLELFRQTGEGLAAAHAAGIIHRDFKPDNVLVGSDGRVYVSDFGLASEAGAAAGAVATTLPVGGTGSPPTLTQTGALVGTPLYMAPEQFAGRRADERSDIFSFFLSLYEALYGELPYRGSTLAELASAASSEYALAQPAGAAVPRWVRRAVRRGLEPRPERRYRSMRDALRALSRDPARRLGRLALAGALVVASGLAIFFGVGEGARPCRGAAQRLQRAWSPARQAEVERGMRGSGLAGAAEQWARTRAVLDGYAGAWVGAYTESCEATRVRGEQSEQLLDARMECLGQRLRELDSLTVLLTRADAAAAGKALTAAFALRPVSDCAQAAALLAPLGPAPSVAGSADLQEARQLLAEATALHAVGRHTAGVAVAMRALDMAQRLAYPALEAEIRQMLCELRDEAGRYREAARDCLAAFSTAEAARHDDIAMRAATMLVWTHGYRRERAEEGAVWTDLAFAKLVRLGTPPLRAAELHRIVASVLWRRGKHAAAEPHARRSLAYYEQLSERDPLGVGSALSTLGLVLDGLGRPNEALATFRRVLEIREQALGREHVDLLVGLGNVGFQLVQLERWEEALAPLGRAVEIGRKILGDTHPDVAIDRIKLGRALEGLGRFAEARAELRAALAIREAAFGKDHANVVIPLSYAARALRREGRTEEAGRLLARALAVARSKLGPKDGRLLYPIAELRDLAAARGEQAQALAWGAQAAELAVERLGPAHPRTTAALAELALLYAAAGRDGDALRAVERALAPRAEKGSSEDPQWVRPFIAAAEVYRRLRRSAEAIDAGQRALATAERVLGNAHELTAGAALALGYAHLDADATPAALPFLERAARDGAASGSGQAPRAQVLLADALWRSGGDRRRARALAEAGLAQLRWRRDRAWVARAEKWLATHRP